MRRNARVDTNHRALLTVARQAGCSVQSLAPIGQGCPDALLGLVTHGSRAVNLLIEIKDGTKPPSHRRLTDQEDAWHAQWCGQVAVVKDADELLALITWAQQHL